MTTQRSSWRFGRLAPILALAILIMAFGGAWVRVPAASAAPTTSTAATGAAAPVAPSSGSADATAAPTGDGSVLRRPPKPKVAGRLNLNTAHVDDLVLLPGIGPAKAERIVAWRQKNGAFRRVLDLRRVKGIGFKTLKRLEPYLAVDGATTLKPAP